MGDASIVNVVMKYFRHEGYKTERDAVLEGLSGLPHKFDLVIGKGKERRLVQIKDWKRTVGVNMVINLDKASADVGLPNPIMVSQKFSGHAKAYANRRAITLLTKRHILRRLG
jgi:hypothetical protein